MLETKRNSIEKTADRTREINSKSMPLISRSHSAVVEVLDNLLTNK